MSKKNLWHRRRSPLNYRTESGSDLADAIDSTKRSEGDALLIRLKINRTKTPVESVASARSPLNYRTGSGSDLADATESTGVLVLLILSRINNASPSDRLVESIASAKSLPLPVL